MFPCPWGSCCLSWELLHEYETVNNKKKEKIIAEDRRRMLQGATQLLTEIITQKHSGLGSSGRTSQERWVLSGPKGQEGSLPGLGRL